MQRNMRNLLIAQLIITFTVAAIFFTVISLFGASTLADALSKAVAAFYGGSILMVNTVIMSFKFRNSESMSETNVQLAIFSGFIQRLIIAIGGFAIGIAWLKLSPGPLVIAFGVSYISFVIAAKNQTP